MDRKAEEVQALLINGEDMIARCRDGDARQLSENLRKLHERVTDTVGKAARKKVGNQFNEYPPTYIFIMMNFVQIYRYIDILYICRVN